MSEAEELLNGMTEQEMSLYLVRPETEEFITINDQRIILVPESLKKIAVQHDNNIETVTFSCPRYWDENDLSTMNIYINFMRIDGYRSRYLTKNIRVDDEDQNVFHFDWTISSEVTEVVGKVKFSVCAMKAGSENDGEIHWNTEINNEMIISEGLECTEHMVDEYPDIINDIIERLEDVEENGTGGNGSGENIDLSEYATKDDLNNKADTNHTHSEYLTKVPEGYATETFVTNKIAEAELSGDGEAVDLSGFATKEDLKNKQDIQNQYTIVENDNYALAICDSDGNVSVAIDNDGKVRIANLEGSNSDNGNNESGSDTSWLKGKHCYVLGDSLSADTSSKGSWHQKFCELTGAILDPDLNRGWFSIGGTATIGTHTEQNACCQMRAKRLVEHYKEGNEVDVIFIQNVNDINNNAYSAGITGKGKDSDLPFFENQVVVYNGHVVETTTPSADVVNYFKENFSTIISDITPMTGTVIEMLYTNGGTAKELTITSAPTSDGNITITTKHGANYRDEKFNIAVKAGMSIEDVVAAILEWNYVDVGKYDDVEGTQGNSVVFSSPYSLTFDGGTTGVTATVTDTSAILRYPIAFTSLKLSDFNDSSKWVRESSVSYWSAQKGLIEYLQKNIPTAKIFYLILPYYKVTYPAAEGSSYLRDDGSFNMEYWVQAGRGSSSAQDLYAEQPLVAKYYGCSCVDVVNNCSISPVNIEEYYPSNDVHPTTAGYNAWGETIARLLAGK